MIKAQLESKKEFLVIGILFALLILYPAFYINRVLPNSYLASLNVSGKSQGEVKKLVDKKFADYGSLRMEFNVGDKKASATLDELGVSLDADRTAGEIYGRGRMDTGPRNLWERMKATVVKKNFVPYYRVDLAKYSDFLSNRFPGAERAAKDATIGIAGGKPAIIPEEPGIVIDRGEAVEAILKNVEKMENHEIALTLAPEEPQVVSDSAQKALERVKSLQGSRITFSWGQDTWRLADDNLLSILQFSASGRENGYVGRLDLGQSPIIFKDVKWADTPKPQLDVTLKEERLDGFLGEIATVLDRPTQNATLKFAGGKVTEFKPAIDGQQLDRKEAMRLVLDTISIDGSGNEGNIQIKLPVRVTTAKVEGNEINAFGIRESIGKGVSYFGGSIANRIYNIGLGASRVSGTLVAPGDVFSFNKSVGEVSGTTGYRQAYIISEGRTVLDDGGGICQVSTTVFRAALAAGVPIVSRTSHAYRVGYYEQGGFRPGLDATVWAPGVDFSFKNDTGRHILVQATVDSANSKLEVDLYGTSDGRKVEISEPVVANIKPALPDKYQDDPTLAKGVTKQVDFSATGADVSFWRKVWKGDNLAVNDVFWSYYRPWQAIYLVGTGG